MSCKLFSKTAVLWSSVGLAMTSLAVVLNQVKGGKGAYGYNAGTGEYGDMIDAGILDPAKVTRLALQNAASVAGLLLTTEVMIAEAPKESNTEPFSTPMPIRCACKRLSQPCSHSPAG